MRQTSFGLRRRRHPKMEVSMRNKYNNILFKREHVYNNHFLLYLCQSEGNYIWTGYLGERRSRESMLGGSRAIVPREHFENKTLSGGILTHYLRVFTHFFFLAANPLFLCWESENKKKKTALKCQFLSLAKTLVWQWPFRRPTYDFPKSFINPFLHMYSF